MDIDFGPDQKIIANNIAILCSVFVQMAGHLSRVVQADIVFYSTLLL